MVNLGHEPMLSKTELPATTFLGLPSRGIKRRNRWCNATPTGVLILLKSTNAFISLDHTSTQRATRRHQSQKSRKPSHYSLSVCLLDTKRPINILEEANALESIPPVETNVDAKQIKSKQLSSELLMNPLAFLGVDDVAEGDEKDSDTATDEYQKGLLTVGFITFLFATNSPVLHSAFSGSNPPPVLLVNASVSLVALTGLWFSGSETTSMPKATDSQKFYGGLELGAWKFLGTTANLYGLAFTTASHGALLIQLTTLIVPISRGIFYGENISNKLKASIGLALAGVLCFAQDPTGTPSLFGDGLCVLAAFCYSAYDLRLYEYGKVVEAKGLITNKIAFQAILSVLLLFLAPSMGSSSFSSEMAAWQESLEPKAWLPVVAAILWSGVAVNAVAPVLQVGGQQIVGPTKCQTIYASQPLWASLISFLVLGETLGISGMIGGGAFVVALGLAATAESNVTADTESTEQDPRSKMSTATTR